MRRWRSLAGKGVASSGSQASGARPAPSRIPPSAHPARPAGDATRATARQFTLPTPAGASAGEQDDRQGGGDTRERRDRADDREELLPAEEVQRGEDEAQLEQAFLNLTLNAVEAMPDGGRLTISTRLERAGALNKQVVVTFADTGVGMSPELLEQIFTPFFSTKVSSGGTGIGLSTVDAIIRGHGGFLRAYSEPGNGTAFTVFLPAVDVAGAAAADVVVTEEARLAELAGHGERILIVDDEADLCRNRINDDDKEESVDVDTPTNIENEDIDSYVNPVPSVDNDS